MKQKYFLKFKWKEMGDEKNISLFHFIKQCSKIVDYSKPILGKSFLGFFIEFIGNSVKYYFVPTSIVKLGKIVFRKIEFDRNFIKLVKKDFIESHKKSADYAILIWKKDLSKKANRELYSYYYKFQEILGRAQKYGWLFQYLEFERPILTDKLFNYLKKQIKIAKAPLMLAECFTILTTQTISTQFKLQERNLLNLALKIKKNKRLSKIFKRKPKEILKKLPKTFPDFCRALRIYTNKYCWLEWGFEGPKVLDEKYVIVLLVRLLKQNNLESKYEKICNENNELKKMQNKIFRELNIDSSYQYLFKVAQLIIYLKNLRKEILFTKSTYYINGLLREICDRLKITMKQLRMMTIKEVKDALLNNKIDLDEINKRINHCVWIYLKGNREWIFSGKEADKIIKKISGEIRIKGEISELKGQCACPGKVKGLIKQISDFKDIPKMRKGDILVASSTNPDIVPAMKKAGAIITDRGGLTCHAAIVSRELNIPCIIGTKIATKVLKDGDLVEVDADKGVVKILK